MSSSRPVHAVAAVIALPGIVAYLVPLTLFRPPAVQWDAWGALGIVAVGTLVLLWCAVEFFVVGHGTLAPWAPPIRLVEHGLYSVSRNPMYIGVLLTVIGWSTFFHSWSCGMYAAVLAIGFHLRVVWYEEPMLSCLFGDAWHLYRSRVHRWLGWRRG